MYRTAQYVNVTMVSCTHPFNSNLTSTRSTRIFITAKAGFAYNMTCFKHYYNIIKFNLISFLYNTVYYWPINSI